MAVTDPTKYTKKDYYMGLTGIRRAEVTTNFTPEMIEEYHRCKDSVGYFAENYVKIVTLDKGTTQIKPVDFQRELWDKFYKHRFHIVLASRQTFKTTTIAIYLLHRVLFYADFSVLILANKGKTSMMILGRIKEMFRKLPMWLQQGVREWNKGNILLENGSSIHAMSSGAGVSRGETGNIVYVDEMAFVENDVDLMTGAFPVISSAVENSQFIMTSTANGVANEFYRYWKLATEGKTDFVPTEIKWNDVPWRGEEYKRTMLKNIPKEQWEQEFENKFLSSDKTLIPLRLLHMIPTQEPVETSGPVKIYTPPEDGKKYVITADVAHGKNQDYSTATVFRIDEDDTYTQVAVARCNKAGPMAFGDTVFELAVKYNRATVAVENNDAGYLVCYRIFMERGYDNMLNRGVKNITDLGIKITKSNKAMACMALKEMFETYSINIVDADTVEELTAFELHGASYAAKPGYHDDLAMNLVMLAYVTNDQKFKHMLSDDDYSAMLSTSRNPDTALLPGMDTGENQMSREDMMWLLGIKDNRDPAADRRR